MQSPTVYFSTEVEREGKDPVFMRGIHSVSQVLEEFPDAIKIFHKKIYPPRLKTKSSHICVWEKYLTMGESE